MPNLAISARSASGDGGSARFHSSCSSAKYASIAGAWITSSRASRSAALPNVCAVPRVTRTKPYGPTASSSSSTVTETSPSSTKYASEQLVRMLAAGGRQHALHQGEVAAVLLSQRLDLHDAAAGGVAPLSLTWTQNLSSHQLISATRL